MCIHYHFDGFSSLLANLVSGKEQFGFLWLGVKFNLWRVLTGDGGGSLGLFFLLCQVVYCAGCTFSQDELTNKILCLKQSWCISKPLSEWGQALWQLLFAVRFSGADSRGAAEWASTGPVLINDANTAPRSNAWANRGDVSPSNRWQSPLSRAPRAAPALGAGE